MIMHSCQSKSTEAVPEKSKFMIIKIISEKDNRKYEDLKELSPYILYIDKYLEFLVSNPIMQLFFTWDSSSFLADKYLVAMVFVYFTRAHFTPDDYTPYSFFVALYLAHDIEEDDKETKYQLYIWALGSQWLTKYHQMLNHRNAFWRAMNYRAIVSRKYCETVMALKPEHPVWKRTRAMCHSNAKCKNPSNCFYCKAAEGSSDLPMKKMQLDLQVNQGETSS